VFHRRRFDGWGAGFMAGAVLGRAQLFRIASAARFTPSVILFFCSRPGVNAACGNFSGGYYVNHDSEIG
jgi:hypothetical protein